MEKEQESKYLYKILCRKDTKHVIQFKIKNITSKIITYYPTNRDGVGTKRCRVEDLDILQISEETTEVVLNNAYVYTMDKSKIKEYQDACVIAFSKRLQLEINRLNKSFEDLSQVEWKESLLDQKGN